MSGLKRLKKIYLAGRMDFIAGWSDQIYWPHESAVVNASFGWINENDSHYPFSFDRSGFHSCVQGYGTGLGISSILNAGCYVFNHPEDKTGYIQYALDKEQGVKGGWQDQIGSIEPGFKLITTSNHQEFNFQNKDDHPIMNHIVLFDTHIRRKSQNIGAQIRGLFDKPDFSESLKNMIDIAKQSIDFNAEDFAKATIDYWKMVNSFVDSDVEIVPKSDLIWGHRLLGAGGGGYGIVLVKNPEDRDAIVEMLKNKGIWSTIPFLLNGPKYLWE